MVESGQNRNEPRPIRIGFMLLPNYTMISLAAGVEPLRMANQLAGKELYEWCLISDDGEPTSASDGILTVVNYSMTKTPPMDVIIVVGGWDIANCYSEDHLKFLRKMDQTGTILGGVCTGPYVLAEAGLLDNCECSVHWECMAAMQERNPLVTCTNRLFTIDEKRLTCTGGTAPLDMMLNVVSRDHGLSLANAISEMFILDRIRTESDNQKVPLKFTTGMVPPKLVEACTLMEANIEELISLEELAKLLNISRRQLERLFKNNLDCSPSRYYLRVRLFRARQLLKQTTLPIIEIASMCGFVSTPHFSKCYRTHLGIPPREERARMQELDSIEVSQGKKALAGKLAMREPSFGSVEVEH